jgi:basic amino acid/polyamine antiporter, APA family
MVRDLAIPGAGILFSLCVCFASGYQAVYQAMVLVLVGIPIYAFLKARRERLGGILEPADHIETAHPGS